MGVSGQSISSAVGSITPADIIIGLEGLSSTLRLGNITTIPIYGNVDTGSNNTYSTPSTGSNSSYSTPSTGSNASYGNVSTGSNKTYSDVATGSNTSYSDVA
jgi:hypothetical protein